MSAQVIGSEYNPWMKTTRDLAALIGLDEQKLRSHRRVAGRGEPAQVLPRGVVDDRRQRSSQIAGQRARRPTPDHRVERKRIVQFQHLLAAAARRIGDRTQQGRHRKRLPRLEKGFIRTSGNTLPHEWQPDAGAGVVMSNLVALQMLGGREVREVVGSPGKATITDRHDARAPLDQKQLSPRIQPSVALPGIDQAGQSLTIDLRGRTIGGAWTCRDLLETRFGLNRSQVVQIDRTFLPVAVQLLSLPECDLRRDSVRDARGGGVGTSTTWCERLPEVQPPRR